ncbi:hypothetical protein HN51_043507 [Arachis hypogaea]
MPRKVMVGPAIGRGCAKDLLMIINVVREMLWKACGAAEGPTVSDSTGIEMEEVMGLGKILYPKEQKRKWPNPSAFPHFSVTCEVPPTVLYEANEIYNKIETLAVALVEVIVRRRPAYVASVVIEVSKTPRIATPNCSSCSHVLVSSGALKPSCDCRSCSRLVLEFCVVHVSSGDARWLYFKRLRILWLP